MASSTKRRIKDRWGWGNVKRKRIKNVKSHHFGYLHVGGEEHPRQRWSSLGLKAEIHPSQNHCHSGSRAGSGPTKPRLDLRLSWIKFLTLESNIILYPFKHERQNKQTHSQVCLWWWGLRHTGTVCRPLECRRRSGPEQSSHLGTTGMRTLQRICSQNHEWTQRSKLKTTKCSSYLLVESKTCSLLCGANLQIDDQIDGNWQ